MSGKKGMKMATRHYYTDEEINFLKDNYVSYSLIELTQKFNERFNLNLKDTTLKSMLSRFKIHSGRSGQWEKGHQAFNKGMKWDDYMSKEGQANSSKTCFSSSNRSINNSNHNELPVGTEAIIYDYVFVKVDYITNRKARRWWKPKHHLIWEKHHGEIPKEKIVIFADGNTRNFDINNLLLIDRKELFLMNQNNLIVKDIPEATKVNLTILKLERKIKDATK